MNDMHDDDDDFEIVTPIAARCCVAGCRRLARGLYCGYHAALTRLGCDGDGCGDHGDEPEAA
jgi:hypothetical protein